MRKERLKYMYWLLGSMVLILFVVGLAAFRNLEQAQGYGKLVHHTNGVLLQTQKTLSLLKDAETGVRGYLLTRDYRFLEPYHHSLSRIKPAIQELDSMTSDNDRQRVPIQLLHGLVNKRFQFMSQSMRISRNTSNQDTLRQILLQSKIVMDSVMLVATAIQKEEERLLSEREHKENEFSAVTPYWLGLISLLAVLLFSITFFAVIQELRKRWLYESQLEQAVSDLRKSNQELENFVYVASHHFQEPLRKIQTFSNRLTTKYQPLLLEDAASLLNRINNASARMQQLLDDLLIYTHVGRQTQEDVFQPLDMSALLRTFVNGQATAVAAAEAKVTLETTDPMPPVLGSTIQVNTLLEQLLENSLKFTRQNIKPIVKIRTFVIVGKDIPGISKEDSNIKFCGVEFSDNGIGFDAAYEDKIFQLFQRLHHTHEYPGTGIGLTICRKVVANHRGHLQVKSQIAVGTTFYIYLPLSA